MEATLEQDTESRTVEASEGLAAALAAGGVTVAFDALAPFMRKQHVRQVTTANAEEARRRRKAKTVAGLQGQETTMKQMNPKVESFFNEADKWKTEYERLRTIVLDCGLNEELKWGKPCYTFQNSNIVLIHGFKEYCALLFHQGALLQDPDGILVQQTKNVQAARQIRFTGVQEIIELEPTLKAYILEAVDVKKAGLAVDFKQTEEFSFPEELINALEAVPGLQDAFDALTPGRQRGYILYFSAAKQSKTRVSRIEKCTPKIFDGKGLNDR